ncbi:hypothetical protein IPJ72_05575 [Candidatus Peregrinibacteria bacterium]|nr:MAG: hypothetical protein IPJ72_05575 [Candidatus Peregrinibacteria bacterium]
MTKFEKKIQHFFERPTTLSYKEIEKILMSIGLEKIAAKIAKDIFTSQ